MQNKTDCYEYGRRIKGYLDKMNKVEVNTSFQHMIQTVGLPDDAVGRIALFSVPKYRTNYNAGEGSITFTRLGSAG